MGVNDVDTFNKEKEVIARKEERSIEKQRKTGRRNEHLRVIYLDALSCGD